MPTQGNPRSPGWWSDVLHRPRRVWLRKAVFQLHLWCGLIVGLLTTVAGLSGSAVVYREALDRRLAPKLYQVQQAPPLSADELLSMVRGDLPEETIQSLDIESGRTPYIFRALSSKGKRKSAFVDPANGALLGIRGEGEGLMDWLDDLHTELLGGKIGSWINAAGAAALFLLCLSGIVVWWPGRRHVRRAVQIHRPRRWRRFNWDIHTAGGFWIALPLAVEAFTGIFLCLGLGWLLLLFGGKKTEFDDLVASPKIPVTCASAEERVSPSIDRARVLHPGTDRLFVLFPERDSSSVTVFSRTPSDLRLGQISVTTLDSCTGTLRKDVHSATSSWALRTVLFLDAFHFGLVGGSLTRVAWVLLGVCPGVLFVTGIVMWWHRAGKWWLRAYPAE